MHSVFVNVLNMLDELEILSYESFNIWEQQQEECDEKQLYLFKNYQSAKKYN